MTEIVPGNISAIRSSQSNSPKLLPFQLYHQTKSTIRTSGHEKIITKSIVE